jgi:peptide/nickel transport system substrate-binding protein
MKKRKLFLLLALVVFLLAACGQDADDTSDSAVDTPDEGAVVDEGANEAADAEDAVVEEEMEPRQLRISFAWPTFIDPAVGSDASSSSALVNLYDSLVFPLADGTVAPWLAESWESSADGLTWTFSLRQDVQFHDGSELEASDVVYSFNRLQTVGEGFGYLFSGVASAAATDDYTVEFTLSEPTGLFVPSLVRLYILNEGLVRSNTVADGAYGDEGDYGKDWLLTNDAGSGPYTVAEFPLEEFLLMEKHEDWWGEFVDNAPDLVRFIATTEAATVRTLMDDGELDISDPWQSIDALENLGELDGVTIAATATFTEFYFMINTRLAPTDDIHCRRAIAYAFDYEQAVGLEWPGTKQSQGPAPAALGGHNSNVFVFNRDLDKANEELAQCQYADSLADHPVEIHWISEVPDEEKFALLFQANMAEIGVTVEVVSTPWLSVVENTSAEETSPHIVTIYVNSDLPEVGPILLQRYHSSTANTWSQNEWLMDAELDAAIEDAMSTTDPDERFAKYAELQATIAELTPSLFIYDQVQKQAYHDYVDWPATRGEMSSLGGYRHYAAQIGVSN